MKAFLLKSFQHFSLSFLHFNFYILLFTSLVLVVGCNAQTEIEKGSRVYIDGVIEAGEWEDAAIYAFQETDYVKTTVYLKHDGKNLLLAFVNDDIKDSTYVMPEMFIDTELNKGDQWQDDDYWFHVSAQDCYAVGQREDYSNCRPDYTVWRASPNAPFGDVYEPNVLSEISIPLQLINLKPGDTFGMCLSLAIYPDERRLNYPESAHEDLPESWQEYILK